MEPVAELASKSDGEEHHHAAHMPFPDIPLDDEIPDAAALSRKLPYMKIGEDVYHEDENDIPHLAEAKLTSTSSSPIRFYDVDGQKRIYSTTDDEYGDNRSEAKGISPRHQNIAQRMAAQSTEKIINEAMHSLFQEKLSV